MSPSPHPAVARTVQEVVKCKWALLLLALVRQGVARPSELQRRATGISFKVMNQRLVKLVRLGVLERTLHAEVPPRVEYRLSVFGGRIAGILDAIDHLQAELDAAAPPARGTQRAG